MPAIFMVITLRDILSLQPNVSTLAYTFCALLSSSREQISTYSKDAGYEDEFSGRCDLITLFQRGDLVQGGEGRRSFIGLEEGDEFGGKAERAGEGGTESRSAT
jgi:hypothetical protein